MPLDREVVITGVGVVSPIGVGRDAFWDALRRGQSGIAPLAFFEGSPWPIRFGGEVADFDPKPYVQPRKSLKVMCREIQMGVAAATLAIEDAALAAGVVAPERLGVVYGSELFYGDNDEVRDAFRNCLVDGRFEFSRWGEQAMKQLYPLWMLKYLPNMAACHIGIMHDARGPNNTVTMAETSSLLAVEEGAGYLRRGWADVMIVGGAGTRINITYQMFRGQRERSRRGDDPQGASRPFDAARDGAVFGEGAGALVLETAAHAAARGATILARLGGAATTFVAPFAPFHDRAAGAARAISQALAAAGVSAEEVGHVGAHGLSTIDVDRLEAAAIRQAVGDAPVTAPKSLFGALGPGSGAVELVASVLALRHGEIPPTRNYETPDPECPVRVVAGHSLAADHAAAVKLNLNTTGQTTAVVLTRA